MTNSKDEGNGAEEQVAVLVNRVFVEDFKRLYKVAYKIVSHHDDAQLVVSEAQVRALVKAHQLKDRPAVRGWVTRIVRNLAINFRNRRRNWLSLDAGASGIQVVDQRDSPLLESIRMEDQRLVREAFARLTKDLQELVKAHYWEKQSMEEIAAAMSLPPGTIKSRLHKARQQMKTQLAGHFGNPKKGDRQREVKSDTAIAS